MEYKRIWAAVIIFVCGTVLVLMSLQTNTPVRMKMMPYFKLQDWFRTEILSVKQETRFKDFNESHQLTVPLSGMFVTMVNIPPPEKPQHGKYIIYRCMHLCGGLGDREKGIVTAYLVSQMLRRKFGIIMNKGCDFSKYVVPNLVDWQIKDEMIKGKSTGSKINIDTNKLGIEMRDGDLEVMYDKEVMFYQGNIDFVPLLMNKTSFRSLSWTKNQTHDGLYRIAFSHLFRLSRDTEQKYLKFKERTSNYKLVCAHLRMGHSKTIPLDAARALKPDIPVLVNFLKGKINNKTLVFVATDSDEARVQMKAALPSQFIEITGPVVHIDRPGRTFNCSGMEKAILDQFILSKCHTLIISESGFSRMAAALRGDATNLYFAVSKNITSITLLRPS